MYSDMLTFGDIDEYVLSFYLNFFFKSKTFQILQWNYTSMNMKLYDLKEEKTKRPYTVIIEGKPKRRCDHAL